MKWDENGNIVEEEIHSGYERIAGKMYQIFDGNEVNACWKKGDYHLDDHNRPVLIADGWHLEDLRQGEVIYRPVENIDKIEINCYN